MAKVNLTNMQQELYQKMKPRIWYCAKELSCRVSTLKAMAKKGALDTKSEISVFGDEELALKFKRRK